MTSLSTDALEDLDLWPGLHLSLTARPDWPVCAALGADIHRSRTSVQPLVEILAAGHGRARGNVRNTATAVGARLRYLGHEVWEDGPWRVIEIDQRDAVSGLEVRSTLRVRLGGHSLQSWTTVRNSGSEPVVLQSVSSFMLADPVGPIELSRVDTMEGSSEWLAENRWTVHPLRATTALPALDLQRHQGQDSRGARALVAHSTWSSGQYVPAGVLHDRIGGTALAWQVEHSGPWRAELGERLGPDGSPVLVLGLFGPTDTDHGWLDVLAPGEEFVSVPVSIAGSAEGWTAAVAEMTRHRRALRTRRRQPVLVFNDYMNTLMGDPTTAKLIPLIDAAAEAGARYFCIDAGWYDEDGDWWDSVGAWEASTTRFPDGGLERVVRHIQDRGMVPGLWLEPEVIGVRSPVAAHLPDSAFLQRHGRRLVEHGRHLLDLRAPAARAHLDRVVDRLVTDLGVGYFKLDHNVTPGPGTDRDADSAGDGLLRHARAHLDWLDGVLTRHPHLVVENCASGAMRADYALLSRLDLQSTSDQQNPLHYPPIAAGAPMSIAPEQAASWAYPQPEMTDEEIVFTMCTGLAGRLYLSGRLDAMTPAQRALVREATDLARGWEDHLSSSVPFWPLGLPGWEDPWVAVGLAAPTESLVVLWWRGPGTGETTITLPAGRIEMAYPADDGGTWEVTQEDSGRTRVRTGTHGPTARILRVVHEQGPRAHPPSPAPQTTPDRTKESR